MRGLSRFYGGQCIRRVGNYSEIHLKSGYNFKGHFMLSLSLPPFTLLERAFSDSGCGVPFAHLAAGCQRAVPTVPTSLVLRPFPYLSERAEGN